MYAAFAPNSTLGAGHGRTCASVCAGRVAQPATRRLKRGAGGATCARRARVWSLKAEACCSGTTAAVWAFYESSSNVRKLSSAAHAFVRAVGPVGRALVLAAVVLTAALLLVYANRPRYKVARAGTASDEKPLHLEGSVPEDGDNHGSTTKGRVYSQMRRGWDNETDVPRRARRFAVSRAEWDATEDVERELEWLAELPIVTSDEHDESDEDKFVADKYPRQAVIDAQSPPLERIGPPESTSSSAATGAQSDTSYAYAFSKSEGDIRAQQSIIKKESLPRDDKLERFESVPTASHSTNGLVRAHDKKFSQNARLASTYSNDGEDIALDDVFIEPRAVTLVNVAEWAMRLGASVINDLIIPATRTGVLIWSNWRAVISWRQSSRGKADPLAVLRPVQSPKDSQLSPDGPAPWPWWTP